MLILAPESARAAFEKYLRRVVELPASHDVAPFPDFPWLHGSIGVEWAVYRGMATEQLREVTNFVNEFVVYYQQLRAWRDVLVSYPESQRQQVAMEFVLPLAYYCTGVPYALLGRVFTSVTHLSHQANRFVLPDWRDAASLKHIDHKMAAKYAAGWPLWRDLDDVLGRVNDSEFVAAVGDFRRLYHHGFPRSLETGLTSLVRREVVDGKPRYAFGSRPPLKVAEIVAALDPQVQAAIDAHGCYVRFVSDQWERVAGG